MRFFGFAHFGGQKGEKYPIKMAGTLDGAKKRCYYNSMEENNLRQNGWGARGIFALSHSRALARRRIPC